MLRMPALICCAVLGLGLAACGDDEDGGAAATATQPMAVPETTMQDAASGDIVAVASETPELSTLVRAVTAAELVETLRGEGPFTVFAPTDEAFASVDRATLDSLLEPANRRQLAALLTYHVVPGAVMAADLRDGQRVETVQGEELLVAIDGETVRVGDATVAQADVAASNGVVHVIDAVLMPPAMG